MGLLQEFVGRYEDIKSLPAKHDFWFEPPDPDVLVQSKTDRYHLDNGKNGLNLDIGLETAPAYGLEGRLNEDCPMVVPMGKGRVLVAVHDGASSRKPIEGLISLNVKGAYYVSHLTSLQFPHSMECRQLAQNSDITAGDIMKTVNKWLNKELSKVEGVDFNDVLSIPGMSATYALIDARKNKITTAHVADTVACIETPNGKMEILSEDQNCKYDKETLDMVERIAENNHITPRQVIHNKELYKCVKEHLAASFTKKINVFPGGCGILNGQPQLNMLIYEKEIPVIPGSIITIASDGIINPYQEKDRSPDDVLKFFLEDINNRNVGVNHEITKRNSELLSEDPEYVKYLRLRNDDRTIIQVKIS